MFIHTEETPNPNTLKFSVNKEVRGSSAPLFYKKESSENPSNKSAVVESLFAIDGIESVFLGSDFITVGKDNITEWLIVKSDIIGTIQDHSNEPFVGKEEDTVNTRIKQVLGEDDIELNNKITQLLDDKVRPAVAMDGGDIIFHSFEKGTLYLEMHGSCSGCPSSTATLKMGIENMMKHYIPEVNRVEAIG